MVPRLSWSQSDESVVLSVHREASTQSDYLRVNAALAAESGDTALAKLQVPTLLLAPRGESRPGTAEDDAQRAAAIIPNARLVQFHDARGGISTMDGTTPPAILAVEQFLQDIGAGDALSTAHASSNLSERELEVLRLLSRGQSNPEIAKELFITRNTVQNHVASILNKTNLKNRAQAAAYAQRHNLL
jgi:DNA-binding CsgD family transcriptional regulator